MVTLDLVADPLEDLRLPEPPPKGLDGWADRIRGHFRRRASLRAGLLAEAAAIAAGESERRGMNEEALRVEIDTHREMFRRGRVDAAALRCALATVREVARRNTGMHPFPVQLAGAIALHRGCLAEMATGEGKSLTAALAAVLAGWSGHPCHVVTVNDYLAGRDAEGFSAFFRACGLSVGCVVGGMPPPDRKRGHAAAITYTTAKELAADLLRDRLAVGSRPGAARRVLDALVAGPVARDAGTVLRGLHTAIIDEADSLLVDEAVTPLIIAGHTSAENSEAALYDWGAGTARDLVEGVHFSMERRVRDVQLKPAGHAAVATRASAAPAGVSAARLAEVTEQAIVAREFFERGRQYIVTDDRVVIVDEFTGRLMPQRKWRAGLHQAIEAAEGVPVTPVDDTMARISFQRFFRLFARLSGMTGTAREIAPEVWRVYRLPVVRIPTNRPCVRRQLPDRIFATRNEKWNAVADEIARLHAAGRPVLVGTRTINDSQELATRLKERQLGCNVLNGVQDRAEAEIVAEAGHPGQITIATNMAGRGTDICLGSGVAASGGLHVIATERHESRRVDRQLYGRSGRQGDLGSAQAFVSLEDELLRRHLNGAILAMVRTAGARTPLARAAFAMAQARAQALAARQRAAVLRQDDWLDDALSFARG